MTEMERYEKALNDMSSRQAHENALRLIGYRVGKRFRDMLPLYFVLEFGITDYPRVGCSSDLELAHTKKK